MSFENRHLRAGLGVLQPMLLRNMAAKFREENGLTEAIDKPNPAKAEAKKRAKSAINMDARERRIEKKVMGARQFKKLLKAERVKHRQLYEEALKEELKKPMADLDATVNLGGLKHATFAPRLQDIS